MRKRAPKGPEGRKRDRKRRNRDAREIGKRRVRTLERYRDGRAYLYGCHPDRYPDRGKS